MINQLQLLCAAAGVILSLAMTGFLVIRKPGASWHWAAALVALVGVWCCTEFLWLRATTVDAAINIIKIQYIAIGLVPIAWLMLCVSERGHPATLIQQSLLFVVPVITYVLAFAYQPDKPNLLWKDIVVPASGIPEVIYGPWCWIFVTHNYLVFAVGWLLMFNQFSQSPHYRLQLFITTSFPMLVIWLNIVHISNLLPDLADTTTIGFVMGLIAWGWAMARHSLLDISPISREVAIDSQTDMIFVVDRKGRVLDYNQAAESYLQSRRKLLGVKFEALIPGLPEFEVPPESTTFSSSHNQYFKLSTSKASVSNSNNHVYVINLRDVSDSVKSYDDLFKAQEQLEHANEELDRLAHTDELTGLANRRFLLTRLDEEIARARRLNQTLAVLFIDLDHFKLVNDNYGHQIGDAVLRNVASALKHHRKGIDIAARYGGEEMVLVVTNTDEAGIFDVAERLWLEIGKLAHETGLDQPVKVTASIGIALLEEQDLSNYDLITRSDKALYHAKQSGRNRVCLARGDRIETLFSAARS